MQAESLGKLVLLKDNGNLVRGTKNNIQDANGCNVTSQTDNA